MNKKIKNILLVIGGLSLFGIIVGLTVSHFAIGSSSPGLYTTLATSSTISVGPGNATTTFVNSPYCTSRVISTTGQAIMLSFGSTTASTLVGHIQPASTTVMYDSGLYGCGQIQIFGQQSSSSISIMEFK